MDFNEYYWDNIDDGVMYTCALRTEIREEERLIEEPRLPRREMRELEDAFRYDI